MKKEWIEINRENKLLILMLSFISITVFSILLTRYTPEIMKVLFPENMGEAKAILDQYTKNISAKNYIDQFSKYISQLRFLITAIIFSDYIVKEVSEGRIYNLLSLGIQRKKILLTKSLMMNIVCILCMVTSLIILRLGLLFYDVYISINLYVLVSLVLILKYLLLINIMTLISTLVKNTWVNLIISLSIYSILSVGRYLPVFKFFTPFFYIYNFAIAGSLYSSITALLATTFFIIIIYIFAIRIFNKKEM